MVTPLTGIRACVFDAYGTLFDYASAAAKCRDVLGDKFAALATYAASDFGMRAVWCNRYVQRRERLPGGPDHVITTLAELPALIANVGLSS